MDAIDLRDYPVKVAPLWWHLSCTASGYGTKIPSRHMVSYANRWRRIYIMCWSNCGNAYVFVKGVRIVVIGG